MPVFRISSPSDSPFRLQALEHFLDVVGGPWSTALECLHTRGIQSICTSLRSRSIATSEYVLAT
jgi:hypothetical protein